MADGNEYNLFQLKEAGQPVEPVYADRGHAAGRRAERHLQERAQSERGAAVPELSASRRNASSSSSTSAALRSVHPQVKEKAGRKPFKDIKTMKDDAAGVEKTAQDDQGALQQAVQGVRNARAAMRKHDILPT